MGHASPARDRRGVPLQWARLSGLSLGLGLVFGPSAVFAQSSGEAASSNSQSLKPVQVEGVRMIRMDANTFRGRWMPINDMPPATVIHEVQLKGGDAPQEFTGKPVEVARPPPAVRTMKRASLRPTETCARHGMRRVTVMRGKWQGWRCRR